MKPSRRRDHQRWITTDTVRLNDVREGRKRDAVRVGVERIDRWLEEIQPDGPEDRPLYGLLVADEQRSVERDIIESLPHWRESGTDFGFRKIRYLVDTLHTVPSHDSWLIQLADCLAYLTNRQHRVDFLLEKGGRITLPQGPQAVLDMYASHVARQVVTRHIWP